MNGKKRRNQNGKNHSNGNKKNGNRVFRIGTCPISRRKNVHLNRHHVRKRIVFGENDDICEMALRSHEIIEYINGVWENMVLRAFEDCYLEIFDKFTKGEINGLKIDLRKKPKPADEEAFIRALMPIVMKEFQEIQERGEPWLRHRIENKGISVKPKKKKEE